MSLEGREHEWGLAVIVASALGLPLGGGDRHPPASHKALLAFDATLLLPASDRSGEFGRPWLMLKAD